MKRTRTNDGRFISDKRQKESAVSTGKEVSDEMENKRKENRRRFCRIVYDEIRRLIERGTLDDIETLIPVSGSFLPFLIKAPDHLGWEDAELYCDENMWKEAFVDAFLFEREVPPRHAWTTLNMRYLRGNTQTTALSGRGWMSPSGSKKVAKTSPSREKTWPTLIRRWNG